MSNAKNIVGAALPALELLHGDNSEIFEVRILVAGPDPNKKQTFSGYFNDVETAYKALCEFDPSWSGAYCTLHAVSPELFNKSPNQIKRAYRGETTPDESITRRRWIALDFDPLRWPKTQPSTAEERDYAVETARNVARFCQFRGMPEPILADSGNGAHLLWKCDIPANSDIHKRMLIEIASKFNSDRMDCDLTIANPSRIWKIYGTLARKGESTPERPFRYSRILYVPEEIEVITEKHIASWVPPAGKESRVLIYKEDGTTKEYKSRERQPEETVTPVALPNRKDVQAIPEVTAKLSEFDPLAKVKSWGLKTLPPFKKGDLTVHELEVCPCGRKERDRASALYILGDGAAGFGCKHATCDYAEAGGNRWKDLRAAYDRPSERKTAAERKAELAAEVEIATKLIETNRAVVTEKKKVSSSDWDDLGESSFFDDDPFEIGGQPEPPKKPEPPNKQEQPKKPETSKKPEPSKKPESDPDLDGILGELELNPEDPEPPSGPDVEVLRPVNINNKVVRSPDGRRMVNIKDDYNQIYNHVFEEISRKEDVYTAQGRLAYVDTDKSIMVPFESGGLDRLAWRACEFVEYKKTQFGVISKPAIVPKRVIDSLYEIDHMDRKQLREVGQVVRSPFFTASGQLITEPGYNLESKTYLIDAPKMEYMGSVDECITYLKDIISDFPFQSDSERANFLGTWLTPLVRAMVTGPVPMTVIEANKRGTGKTKLAQLVQITYGMNPEVGDLPKEEENMEKLMLSIIVEGKPIHLFDNVKHSVNSACLDRILTTGFYSGRLLGKTKNLHCEVLQLFIMTSNNTRMSEDMSRRFARVRLRTNLKNPERRSDVSIVDILGWTKQNRGKILSALAGLVLNWINLGMPIPDSLPRLGSFEGWRNVVGAILAAAGETNWMENMDEAMNESLIVDEWEQFVDCWYMELGVKTSLTSLLGMCERKGIFGGLLRGENGQKLYALRMAILEKRDTVVGDFRIMVEKDTHTKTLTYKIEKLDWSKKDA